MNWIIRNIHEPDLRWSNEDGWTEDTYDTFTDKEKDAASLPIDGEWEQVAWSVA